MRKTAEHTPARKKTEALRNVRAFVASYLKGKNGQEALKRNKPFAIAFAKAL